QKDGPQRLNVASWLKLPPCFLRACNWNSKDATPQCYPTNRRITRCSGTTARSSYAGSRSVRVGLSPSLKYFSEAPLPTWPRAMSVASGKPAWPSWTVCGDASCRRERSHPGYGLPKRPPSTSQLEKAGESYRIVRICQGEGENRRQCHSAGA